MATGFYHVTNILKYRILSVLVKAETSLTTQDIADLIGVDRKRITDCITRWHKYGYGYSKRLKTKRGQYHLYVITKKGAEAFVNYDSRFRQGKSLNLKKSKPENVESVLNYFGINKNGRELGLTKNDIPSLAGLKKRNLDKNGD